MFLLLGAEQQLLGLLGWWWWGGGCLGSPRGGSGAVLPLALRTLPLCCQTEIAKRLNVICAQLIPFLSQEVGEPVGSVPAHRAPSGHGEHPCSGPGWGGWLCPIPCRDNALRALGSLPGVT